MNRVTQPFPMPHHEPHAAVLRALAVYHIDGAILLLLMPIPFASFLRPIPPVL